MASKKPQCKVGEDKSETIRQLPMACSDEAAALDFMELQRWGDSPCCPLCGSVNVYRMTGRSGQREAHGRWRCRDCRKLYSVRTGTVMEESRIPLRHWCFAFWRASTSKKGASALEIKRQTGLSYKSALFMMHRIRFAMAPTDGGKKLGGIVEADEMYWGGKPRPISIDALIRDPNLKTNHQTRAQRLAPIFGAVQRHGQVRLRALPRVTAANLRNALMEHVDRSARLVTDEHKGYHGAGKPFARHDTINHSERVYVRGDVTTNTIESVFAILRRGLTGIYHNVSKEHLQRYLDEFEFRYNHRELEDGDRVIAAIRGADGKRLTYRMPA